jgi:hypothetical protein
MINIIAKYVSPSPPDALRPFDAARDITRVEDHMTALRPLQFVDGPSPDHAEFCTLEYDITATRHLTDPEQPEQVFLHLVVTTPQGRMAFGSTHVVGVDVAGALWFASYGGYISDTQEIALKKEARTAYDEIAKNHPEMLQDGMRDMRDMDPTDEDWWKRGEPPPHPRGY